MPSEERDSDDEIEEFHDDIDRFLLAPFSVFGSQMFKASSDTLRPLSSVDVTHDYVTVTFDIPGVSKEAVSVTCTEEFVSMEAESRKEYKTQGRHGSSSRVEVNRFSERIRLPVPVNPDGGTAKFNNGMLVVKLPRVQKGSPVMITGGRHDRK